MPRSALSSTEQVRSHFHNLAARTERAIASGLVLRKRTAEHLRKMTEVREYLVSRYGPEMTSTLSELNRLTATLEEVSRKTKLRIGLVPQGAPNEYLADNHNG